MKTIPPASTELETGRRYWRSLDQVSDTPEFRQWLEREFPSGASEMTADPVTRRHFVKIMSASFALAGLGLTGCRRPESELVPFSKQPEGYIHGVANYFATAMPNRGGAIPLLAKSHDGRPVKLEGNSLLPGSNGGTDRFAQASILNLYDPDRAQRCTQNGKTVTPEAALDMLSGVASQFTANQGEGLAFLIERGTSPSRVRLGGLIAEKMPKARAYAYDSTGGDVDETVATEVFGKPVRPRYLFEKAEVIVSLDCDFLGSEDNVAAHIRGFADGRRVAKSNDSMSRLYVVESLMTLTGANADHRLRMTSGSVQPFTAALAAGVGAGSTASQAAELDQDWVDQCAADLLDHKGRSLIVAGSGQPPAVQALAYAMNAALGNIGKTLVLHEAFEPQTGSLEQLATSLNNSQVDTLVILGGNPVYSAPADLDWAAAQRKAKTVVRLGYYEDETAEASTWTLPETHYLESWGDARTYEGTIVPTQPLIAPLFGGFSELEVVARIAGHSTTKPHDIVRETFNGLNKGSDDEAAWRKFLHDGFLAGSSGKPVSVTLNTRKVASLVASAPQPNSNSESLEVVFGRDYKTDDGRYNNNGWMQELPDPITKLTWDNVVQISRKTAKRLDVQNNDVVRIEVSGHSVEGPIWVQPGQADNVLGLKLGYGRTHTGRIGTDVGFNVGVIRTSTAMHIAPGATLEKTGATYPLSGTQEHWSMEGRAIIREASLKQWKEHPDFVNGMSLHEPPVVQSMYPNPLENEAKSAHHQWGMSIDLNACVGCSSCVIACQSENNIPIVGKDQVSRGREMHWMRIDRYYVSDPEKAKTKQVLKPDSHQQFEEWIDDVQVVNQPMLCQHCETAPCESVCPVNATVHDHEGLNIMAYNRCVGTRYCSNNCPYKVRRFNFFDYNKRPIDQLYKGPLAKRPAEELELLRMISNPEVSVRMRGVMEKCTFCLQRIESAKIDRKVKAGPTGDVVVPDGTIKTACQQACPADAIVFGNVADSQSQVSKLKQQSRDYSVLGFLLTKPRLTYLAKLRNPNAELDDYESPLSLQEYEQKMGSPFEQHGAESHATEAGAHDAGEAGH